MPSLPDIAAEAVYRVPTATNLGILEELIAARVEAAADHVWSLRQDPGYFADYVRQTSCHSKDYDYDVGYFFRSEKPLPAWTAAQWTISIAIADVEKWCHVQHCFQSVLSSKGDISDDIVRRDLHDWPRPHVEALVTLSRTLNDACLVELYSLRDAIYCSPLTRHFWGDDEMEKAAKAGRESEISFLSPRKDYKVPDDLLMALLSLLTMAGPIQERPIRQEIEHIDRILSSDSSQRAKITPFIWEILANIQVLQEIDRQLVQYCPWLVHHEEMRKEFVAHVELGNHRYSPILYKDPDKLEKVTELICNLGFGKIEAPVYLLFDYPADKRRTAQNVNQMQIAEHNLYKMWADIDRGIQIVLDGETLAQFIPALDFSGRVLQRTPDFVVQTRPTTTVDQPLSSEFPAYFGELARTTTAKYDILPAHKTGAIAMAS